MLGMTEKCYTNTSGQMISCEFLTSMNVYNRVIRGFPYCLIADVRILALTCNHRFAQMLTQIWNRKSPFKDLESHLIRKMWYSEQRGLKCHFFTGRSKM